MATQTEIVVRFAGEGGQGVVTAAEMLARAATGVGFHALTFATFPSQILGGPTWTQARIARAPVQSPGDSVDILVAFNDEAYNEHRSEVRDGGVILLDPSIEPDPRRRPPLHRRPLRRTRQADGASPAPRIWS